MQTTSDNRNSRRSAAQVGHRILLVDDDEVNQILNQRLFQDLGWQCTCLYSGREAVDYEDLEAFTIIFMDVLMPEMDGLEASRRIREKIGHDRPPFICALTANPYMRDNAELKAAGIDGFITKPLNTENLNEAINRFLALCVSGAPALEDEPEGEPDEGDSPAGFAGPGNLQRLDKSALRMLFDGSREARRKGDEILRRFLKDFPDKLDSCFAKLDQGDAGGARFVIHTLKGSTRVMGAEIISSLLADLEDAIEKDDYKVARFMRQRIEKEFLALEEEVKLFILGSHDLPADSGSY